MREVISISMPKPESAFFKANPFSGPEVKETPLRKWSRLDFCLYLEEEDNEIQKAMTRSLNKARKRFEEDLAQGDVDDEVQGEGGVGELHHPNQFGRGQPITSVGTGWKPKPTKPIQWKLLGGAGGKKNAPSIKGQKQDGNYKFRYLKDLSSIDFKSNNSAFEIFSHPTSIY